MIYLDVTSAAASPVNMGVQRTIRGVYTHLLDRHEVTPVRWDFSSKRYARLSPREQTFLDQPFASYQGSVANPDRGWDHFWATWKDSFGRRERRLEHEVILRGDNVLLIPDLCWDIRIRSWKKMGRFSGKRMAIFHDAMPLRIKGQAGSHDSLFAEYVRCLNFLDLVICISNEVEEDLLRYWKECRLEPKPTCVITWPVPFVGARAENPPNQAARKVIYVSRLKLRKNHLVLLEACEQLWQQGEKFELDLIGIEDDLADTKKILNQVQLLASRNRPVKWLKHISDAELNEAYRDCAFSAFPSRLEGFGLPIIESLWHARPVICGKNGAIGEVAAGGGCYQIDQNNAQELAHAIRLLLNDPATYQRLYDETRQRLFRSWDDYGRDIDVLLPTASAVK